MGIEERFVTLDGDQTFRMIEDEWGDTFWAYDHVSSADLVNEVNNWLVFVGAITVPDDLFPLDQKVDHLWAKEDPCGERFTIVNPQMVADDELFPITRLCF